MPLSPRLLGMLFCIVVFGVKVAGDGHRSVDSILRRLLSAREHLYL